MLTVPGVLPASAKPPSPAKAAPPEPMPDTPTVTMPPTPAPAPPPPRSIPRPAAAPPNDGVPGVVLVEVPVKPVPPPLPQATEPARAGPAEPPPARPTMTLSGRERPRRNTNRPRRPSSALAGLALAAMAVLFVALGGVSLATWGVTELQSQQPRPGFVGVNPGKPMLQPPMVGGGPVFPQQQRPDNGGQGSPQVFNPRPNGPKFDDKLAKPLKLQNGQADLNDLITNNDPRDPVRRWPAGHPQLPAKVYLVELEQGRKYIIEMQNPQKRPNFIGNQIFDFDPYLRIENLDGERLAEDDDIVQGTDTDARIEFHPPKTATYRIFCTVFDHPVQPGQGSFRLSIRERPVAPAAANLGVPQSFKGNEPFNIVRATEKDLEATVVSRRQAGITAGELSWSGDGTAFYVLYHSGVLMKFGLKDFAEQRRLVLGRTPGTVAMSGQGLVVTMLPQNQGANLAPVQLPGFQAPGFKAPIVPGTNEVWLIDPDGLAVKKRFGAHLRPVDGATVASAPGLDYAYVASAGETGSYPGGHGVLVLDLSGKQTARFFDLPHTALAVSPRGDYLFAMDNGVLVSFAINKQTGTLEPKQTSHPYPRNGNTHYRIDVSGDGKFVAVSGADAPKELQAENPRLRASAVPVYAVENLRKPVFTLDTDMPGRAVGFDITRADRMLGQTQDATIAVFDGAGKRRGGYRVPDIGNKDNRPQSALQFLVHPDGNKVLVRYEDRFCFANFKPDVAPAVVRNDPTLPVPAAIKDGESVAGEAKKQIDVTYRELTLANLGDIDPCWDADGKALFHLDNEGTLTRYRAGDFTPTDRLMLGRPAAAMALSAQGLLVALRDQPEVWVIQPQALKVVRSIAMPSPARYLACQPQQARAVAVGTEVVLLDLVQGKALARGLAPHEDAGLPFHRPAITPDGKYVFLAHTSAAAAKVLRVRIEADRLVFEDSRNLPGRGTHAFCVTADGKHVAWYSPVAKGKQQPAEFYAVADWKAPAFVLPVTARALTAADDGSLYAQTPEFDLYRYTQPAKDAPSVSLRWASQGRIAIRDIAPQPRHPGAFVASTGGRVLYGERSAK